MVASARINKQTHAIMPYQDTNSHVDLGKHGPSLADLLGQLLVHRGHHPARTASVGIEIDDDRKAGLGRVLLEEAIEFVRRPDMPDQRSGLHYHHRGEENQQKNEGGAEHDGRMGRGQARADTAAGCWLVAKEKNDASCKLHVP